MFTYDLLQNNTCNFTTATVTGRSGNKNATACNNEDATIAPRKRKALGLAAWMETFWIPTQQRKYPAFQFSILKKNERIALFIHPADNKNNNNEASDDSTTNNTTTTTTNSDAFLGPTTAAASTPPDWQKVIQTAMKKIHVEDLGDLAARDLWATIPVEDSDGRGRQDLERLEKQLTVKVVFLVEEDDNHVLLVGAKAKLEKKCLVIRNILSHYYWRLKGKQINL